MISKQYTICSWLYIAHNYITEKDMSLHGLTIILVKGIASNNCNTSGPRILFYNKVTHLGSHKKDV